MANGRMVCNLCGSEFSPQGITRHLKSCKGRSVIQEESIIKEKNQYKLLKLKLREEEDMCIYIYAMSSLKLRELDHLIKNLFFNSRKGISLFTIDGVFYKDYSEQSGLKNSSANHASNKKNSIDMTLDETISVKSKIIYHYELTSLKQIDIKVHQDLLELRTDEPMVIVANSESWIKRLEKIIENIHVELETLEDDYENEEYEEYEEYDYFDCDKMFFRTMYNRYKKMPLWSAALSSYREEELFMMLCFFNIDIDVRACKSEFIKLFMEKFKSDIKLQLEYMGQSAIESYQKIVEKGGIIDLSQLSLFEYLNFDCEKIGVNVEICETGRMFQIYPSFNYGKYIGFLPQEVYIMLSRVEFSKYKKTSIANDKIAKIVQGLLEVYGVMHIEGIVGVLEHHGLKVHRDDLEKILRWASISSFGMVSFFGGYFALNDQVNIGDYIYSENYDQLDYKLFPKSVKNESSFIKYLTTTKNVKKFAKYLKDIYGMPRKMINEMIENSILFNNITCDDVNDLFEQLFLVDSLNPVERADLKVQYLDMILSLPKWELKGHSINEFNGKSILDDDEPSRRNLETENSGKVYSIETKKKIGRNDNCPCGSGKKFKKCCGK